ncbi:serine-type D-Ala-D-Ala carboxypeptidase DacD [Erwinia aphidicola]|uniref:serine-type D-Ala-D-Ala carboxypeptidase n=1 Tax=Erwinia aphidicola TaxID=68334 RepID=A0ABU8DL88_ERWAP|nr:serine-type D-Ala-D-Ala carboxypeptidase DacD [Erwinia aphidicola]KMV71322.1 D-alanyl-D-alanine carboxypeptidase [bacteria symbiont BFo1 of Frankliniella occidentalis]MBD1375506.1 serine-type D-Ala-D-Ala carboxypeptidase DacD [Erwinia aphidicola]PIJ60275.1 serine-type D-Ala-D-Ala carboxypeptidase [Erwinia sp. OLMDLW33]CAH0229562.1 D-alanyl-D-alanine carboxypeptidase DacD [Erwinia aphidicola]
MKKRQLVSLTVVMALSTVAHAENNPGVDALAFPMTSPAIDAASWVLMDATTGQILSSGNPDERRNPASLTKLMTGYVVDRAIDKKRISRDDMVTVGQDAWGAGNPVFKGSSLMFLKPGEKVSVRDLSRGVIIDSGNDACVALADYVAGSEANFVTMMNQYVEKLGLSNTHFETVHGLDAPGQFTTARDLAKLSRAIISGEPDFYQMYSEKSLTWNGITQQNRNGLLWDKTLHVDGLKTGHTESAGFNIIASSVDGQRRLIAVVMGGKSPKGREEQARKLLIWGQSNFDTVQLFHAGKEIGHENVWYGNPHRISLGSENDVYLTLPRDAVQKVKAKYVIDRKDLEAPIKLHEQVGTIQLVEGDKQLASYPLVALQPIEEAGVITRISDYIKRKL